MIGEKLRQAREAKNLSVQDIEKETSIRVLYIEAIEKGDYKTLPGEAYLKGFIKSYANCLGLDGQALVEEYKAEQGQLKAADEAAAEQPTEQTAAKSAKVNKPAKQVPSAKRKEPSIVVGGSNKPLGLIAAGVAALLILLGGYNLLFADDEAVPTAPVQAASTTKPTADGVAKQSSSAANMQSKDAPTTKTAADTASAQELDLDLKLNGRCWLQVEVDGRVVYEGTAQSGEKLSWKGKKNIKITAGNAAAVELAQNGRELGKLGGEGEVITKEFGLTTPDKKK